MLSRRSPRGTGLVIAPVALSLALGLAGGREGRGGTALLR
jgi:hypothetical protein